MSLHRRLCWIAALLMGPMMAGASTARAELYVFAGAVTEVVDPFGALTGLASVGAPVTGAFQYTYSTTFGSFSLTPYVTAYGNDRSLHPELTDLSLVIAGVTERSDAGSLTNLQVGDDVPAGTPIFPAGDLFRYGDSLRLPDGLRDGLVDYTPLLDDYLPFAFGDVVLNDPTGTVFASQALPPGTLPLPSLANRYGDFYVFDGNGNYDGPLVTVRFRIDSIRAVPEPSSIVLMAIATLPGAAAWLRCRAHRHPSPRADRGL